MSITQLTHTAINTNQRLLSLAQSPTTPSLLLDKLVCASSAQVRRAVAQNPNTSLLALLSLGREFPQEVLQNPALPLWILEDPSCLQRCPEEGLLAMLCSDLFPASYLSLVMNHPSLKVRVQVALAPGLSLSSRHLMAQDYSVALALATHPCTPPEVLCTLTESAYRPIRKAASVNRSTPKEQLARLRRAGAAQHLTKCKTGETLSAQELSTLANGGFFARELAAYHPNTPPAVLLRLVQDESPKIRLATTKNPSLSSEHFLMLSGDNNVEVREQLARHPRIRCSVLARLACDQTYEVRRAVTAHPRTPLDVLKMLAIDRDNRVRGAVAKNPQLSAESLELLSKDRSHSIRWSVAQNPMTTESTLRGLIGDSSAYVRARAALHPNAPQPLLSLLRAIGVRADLAGLSHHPSLSKRLSKQERQTIAQCGPFGASLLTETNHIPAHQPVVPAKRKKKRRFAYRQ
jgi:hypothetical protein